MTQASLDCCPEVRPRLRRATLQLALICTLNYGALLYLLPVLVLDMSQHWQLPSSYFFWAYSLMLLVCALVSPWVGRKIEGFGARLVLVVSCLMGSALLVLASLAPHVSLVLLAIVGLGVAKAGAVYEASFAYCYRRIERAASTILWITLLAGFASTIFVPLAHGINQRWGWQVCLLVFAVMGPGLSALLAASLPKDQQSLADQSSGSGAAQPVASAEMNARQAAASLALQLCFILFALVATAVTANLYPIMAQQGVDEQLMLLAMMAIGPAQSLARLGFGWLNQRLGSQQASLIALASQPLAFALLLGLAWHPAAILAFAVAFGLANGAMTMVRAISIADLFGRSGYAARAGKFAAPSGIAAALAPGLLATLWGLGWPIAWLAGLGFVLGLLMLWQFKRSYWLLQAPTKPSL